MNRPKSFLHVVGGKQVCNTREFVQQVVLKTEQRGRPHDRGFRENAPNNSFSAGLNLMLAVIGY